MHWIDIAGAMAASRHSNRIVATVALDSLDFRHPARMGELVMLKAKLTWVGRTSMEVKVSAYAENLKNRKCYSYQSGIYYICGTGRRRKADSCSAAYT